WIRQCRFESFMALHIQRELIGSDERRRHLAISPLSESASGSGTTYPPPYPIDSAGGFTPGVRQTGRPLARSALTCTCRCIGERPVATAVQQLRFYSSSGHSPSPAIRIADDNVIGLVHSPFSPVKKDSL